MNIFVGNLSFETHDEGLRAAFAEHGAVDTAQVVMDRQTGRSRGFGFVTFTTEEAASSARESMDGATLGGRTIRVDLARERQGGGGGGGYRR